MPSTKKSDTGIDYIQRMHLANWKDVTNVEDMGLENDDRNESFLEKLKQQNKKDKAITDNTSL